MLTLLLFLFKNFPRPQVLFKDLTHGINVNDDTEKQRHWKLTVLLTFLYGGALSYRDMGIPGLSVDGGREQLGEVWPPGKGEAVQGK